MMYKGTLYGNTNAPPVRSMSYWAGLEGDKDLLVEERGEGCL